MFSYVKPFSLLNICKSGASTKEHSVNTDVFLTSFSFSFAATTRLIDFREQNSRGGKPEEVPLAMAIYQELRTPLGSHGGLAAATGLSTAGEVALTGWSERFGVHMGYLDELGEGGTSFWLPSVHPPKPWFSGRPKQVYHAKWGA